METWLAVFSKVGKIMIVVSFFTSLPADTVQNPHRAAVGDAVPDFFAAPLGL